MKLRPCIDIHDGRVKQIVGSTLSDRKNILSGDQTNMAAGKNDEAGVLRENFVSAEDASFYAGIYREKHLPGGHIILLNSKNETAAYEADRRQAFHALKAWPGGMQVGGGITPQTAGDFLEAGASHVIVTSYVFRDGRLDADRLERMEKAVGTKHLVLDLSCRKRADGTYAVVTDRWQKFTSLIIQNSTLDMLSGHCDEFLIHAADVEGKRSGVETDLLGILGNWQKTRIKDGRDAFPITYAGGVHSLDDIGIIVRACAGSVDVTVGSALDLFGGNLTLDDLTKACRRETAEFA